MHFGVSASLISFFQADFFFHFRIGFKYFLSTAEAILNYSLQVDMYIFLILMHNCTILPAIGRQFNCCFKG